MDVRQILLDTESTLRDFVSMIMEQQHGEDWIHNSGLSSERIRLLEEEKDANDERKISIQDENRLINNTNIIDLKTIISKNWTGDFEVAFGDWDTLSIYLSTLYRYYDPDSHQRALLTHQKHLILGISGFIRNRIVVYRSWKEGNKKGFPKIESVRDNLGNIWVPGKPKKIKTGLTLHPGDTLEFVITGKDPKDQDLSYRIYPSKWSTNNVQLIELTEKHIGSQTVFHIGIRGPQKHHAYPLGHDDRVTFEYEVLPND